MAAAALTALTGLFVGMVAGGDAAGEMSGAVVDCGLHCGLPGRGFQAFFLTGGGGYAMLRG